MRDGFFAIACISPLHSYLYPEKVASLKTGFRVHTKACIEDLPSMHGVKILVYLKRFLKIPMSISPGLFERLK